VDKEKYIWKERNEILHKKVNRQMAEIKDLNKKSETIFDLARRFPNKTYSELERYRDADRQEEAQQIPLTESQKSQDELEPLTESQKDLVQTVEKAIEKNKKGTCITGELRKDRQEMNPKIKALEEALANALAVNESHQKLNGTLQERLTEVEEDNKKMARQIEDKINRMRRSGL
jgi:myosin heavy subunit